jgi:hypothetical protein
VTIARVGSESIDFVCGAVLDFSEFQRVCPPPVIPFVQEVGKPGYHDMNDKTYLAALDKHSTLNTTYLILASLAGSDIEWTMVDMNDPSTWDNYEAELAEFFTNAEIATIVRGVMDANLPNKSRSFEALGNSQPPQQGAEVQSTSQKAEQDSTPSGKPAKD